MTYECDPKKNTSCNKLACNGGKDARAPYCHQTSNPKYKKDNENVVKPDQTQTQKAKQEINEKEKQRKEEAVFKN